MTQTETASVHTVDHIAALISCIMRKFSLMNISADFKDLADAYKQLPLSDEAFRLDSYLVVFSPVSKGPEVFQQSVLPFGSVASVTAFLRVAQAIWKLGTKLCISWIFQLADNTFSLTGQTVLAAARTV